MFRRRSKVILIKFILCSVLLLFYVYHDQYSKTSFSEQTIHKQRNTGIYAVIQSFRSRLNKLFNVIKELKTYLQISTDNTHIQELIDNRMLTENIYVETYEGFCRHTSKVVTVFISKREKGVYARDFLRRYAIETSLRRPDNFSINLNWETIFFIGKNDDSFNETEATYEWLQKEMMQQDIAVADLPDLPDSHPNFKVMAAIDLIYRLCSFEYLLIVNDRMLVNIPALFHFIHNPKIQTNNIYIEDHVEHGLPEDAVYFLSRDVVQKIVPLFDWEKDLLYLSEILMKANVTILKKDNFVTIGCTYNRETIVNFIEIPSIDCVNYLRTREMYDNKNKFSN